MAAFSNLGNKLCTVAATLSLGACASNYQALVVPPRDNSPEATENRAGERQYYADRQRDGYQRTMDARNLNSEFQGVGLPSAIINDFSRAASSSLRGQARRAAYELTNPYYR